MRYFLTGKLFSARNGDGDRFFVRTRTTLCKWTIGDDETLDLGTAEAMIGYRMRGWHIAAVAWVEPEAAPPAAFDVLDEPPHAASSSTNDPSPVAAAHPLVRI